MMGGMPGGMGGMPGGMPGGMGGMVSGFVGLCVLLSIGPGGNASHGGKTYGKKLTYIFLLHTAGRRHSARWAPADARADGWGRDGG